MALVLALAVPAHAAPAQRTYFCSVAPNAGTQGVSMDLGLSIFSDHHVLAGMPPLPGRLLDQSSSVIAFTTPGYIWMMNIDRSRLALIPAKDPDATWRALALDPKAPVSASYAGPCEGS